MYQIEIEDEKPAFLGESASGFQVHYTQKDDALYAIFLDWPGQGTTVDLTAVTPASLGGRTIRKATLLSVKKNYDCPFEQQAEGLRLTIPCNGRYPADAAQVVRLEIGVNAISASTNLARQFLYSCQCFILLEKGGLGR